MSDMINRADALNSPITIVSDGFEWIPTFHIKNLPSAERTGEWIRESLTTDCPYKCSACKKYSRARYDFCPNCGARMVSE